MTFAQYSPDSQNVGDVSGYPSNLVWGLAWMYRRGIPLREELTRALFTAVLRSSKQHYARPFGWLLTREQSKGANPSGGEVRMLLGVTEMLANLSP
jgi:hypothetical protein